MVVLQPRPLASLPTARLSTGDPVLDSVLGGGLPVGQLVEVAGTLTKDGCIDRCAP